MGWFNNKKTTLNAEPNVTPDDDFEVPALTPKKIILSKELAHRKREEDIRNKYCNKSSEK